ncbi:PREDICTED: rho GTPase-activating protein 100F isoform X3 [Drosophila arizonae]|uniref:Rho GTPase-activating protein 100F isoform X3 n=1 Tax=Drosophila arizonae TaxID=7263 RepID=A0ABM1Q1B4_DROAR|nr:PREDICTED: rho GTPase-activating protein 100F isoform X3 [Drosophila arizonae]
MCERATTGCFLTRSSGRKENGRSVPDVTASPGRAPPGPLPANQLSGMGNQQQHHLHANQQQQQQQQQQHHGNQQQNRGQSGTTNGSGGVKDPVLLQGDFRKVSGISSEIFRQIEAVENDHDPNTAAALEAVERRGEMIVRILEPRSMGSKHAVDAAHKLMNKADGRHTVQLVEIVKRPGQTLGLYIREGNGADRTDGVFISRIALESAVYNSGCLRVGDEILAVNLVDVTHMSLDDVVIIMSIPRRLVLAIRQRRGNRGAGSPGPPTLSRPEQKPPPVVVIKRDIRDEDLDETDRMPRPRSSRERRTGDGREMTESRSRLGLGLNNYSPQSEQLDMYYNTRGGVNAMGEPPNWGYKPPPPPSSVITEQPTKGHAFAPSHAYYQNAGTLESLAEKVHAFYPGAPGQPLGPSRRMSTGTGNVGLAQQHARFPRSGSDQHLPRVEYADYSNSLGRHSLLRSSLKPGTGAPMPVGVGGTLGRYGRYDQQRGGVPKYGPPAAGAQSLTRRSRPNLDYSSDTEATIGPRPSYYYYNRPAIGSMPRGSSGVGGSGAAAAAAAMLAGGPDLNKFNSLPRERPGARLQGIRARIGDRILDENDGNISAPEYDARRGRDLRQRITASPGPSIFTADEYRAWLRRAPSSSAIAEQMRMTRDMFAQPRSHRFSCSAENIHDALRNTESIYSSRTGILGTGTLDRNLGLTRPISALPVRSMSSQHIGGAGSIRSPSIRRMRQLLELSAGPASPSGSIMSTAGHQSPAPTPSATMPRAHRQIDINPAEFAKYKLDKPIVDIGGVSGMLWIHLLAGRGLRSTPEQGAQLGAGGAPLPQTRDLYCVIECDRVHKARTVVRSGDLQFDWDESFELDLVGNKQLDVLVYSWDPQHRHKLCYRGAISLSAVLRQSPLHQLALKVEPRGTVYIRMRHTDPLALYKRRGLPSLRAGYPTLFGADLETVVNRESKNVPGCAPVPIVLRRCVEEVERRGLDIIGLYRLCGSATKKRLLREAFERNSRAVELSPEHVPDINVITGVLKDYLRELPEPLFTRCLFQMTVDALAVCLPDDPEGNAKLMLSILDCLPRANRATLVFLLDHLSLVVSNAERNKMSAQALATVMGPPLMLHSASAQPGADIDHAQPIAVLKYLLQIWPQPQAQQAQHQQLAQHMGGMATASSMSNMAGVASGRRGESTGQRGSKVSALPVDRQQILLQQQQQLMAAGNLLRSSTSVTNILSQGHHQLSATANSHLYQSVVGQLAQSHRALQQAVQQPYQLGGSAGSAIPDQSPLPLPGTPSPGSSSASTGSGSGSGSGSGKSTDTIKRGASPASVKQVKVADTLSPYSVVQKKPPLQKDAPIEEITPPEASASASAGASGSAASSTNRKGVDFYEPHNSHSKSLASDEPYTSKYSSSTLDSKKNSYGSSYTPSKSSNASNNDDYKVIRNKTSATSSSSSSQATVLSAGSTATSAPTTSSDDSDDLVSYKSSASTNALLAQSQAMTTSQLMSKYLKREPRVQFTPIKSPDSPSPPGGGDGLPKGTYQLVTPSSSTSCLAKPSATTGAISKYTTSTSSPSAADTTTNPTSSSSKLSSPSRLAKDGRSGGAAVSSSSSSLVSSGRRLFDSLASSSSSETETKTYIGGTTVASAVSTTSTYTNDSRNVATSNSSKTASGSEHRSFGSALFGSSAIGNGTGNGNGHGHGHGVHSSNSPFASTNGNASTSSNHSAMNLYGTLPKNGAANGSSAGATLFGASASASSSYHSGSGTASSSGVSSMTGSTNSYDFYTGGGSAGSSSSSTRPFANGGNNYHTLGTYRAQYAATNPFLDAFDEKPSSNGANNGHNSHHVADSKLAASSDKGHQRASMVAAFQSSGDSKNGSDEYDDLK